MWPTTVMRVSRLTSLVSLQTRLSSCASWLMMMTPPENASSASANASMDCKDKSCQMKTTPHRILVDYWTESAATAEQTIFSCSS